MFETRNDLSADTRTEVIRLLNARLADAIDLALQTKHAHWNVKGPNFIALHELFDQIAEQIEAHVDGIAERVTALGGTAGGTLAAVSRTTTLKAYPEQIVEGAARLGDADSADLFTEVSREADKQLWFLEAHLHAPR